MRFCNRRNCLGRKACGTKRLYREVRFAIDNQIGKHGTDNRGELKSVPGEAERMPNAAGCFAWPNGWNDVRRERLKTCPSPHNRCIAQLREEIQNRTCAFDHAVRYRLGCFVNHIDVGWNSATNHYRSRLRLLERKRPVDSDHNGINKFRQARRHHQRVPSGFTWKLVTGIAREFGPPGAATVDNDSGAPFAGRCLDHPVITRLLQPRHTDTFLKRSPELLRAQTKSPSCTRRICMTVATRNDSADSQIRHARKKPFNLLAGQQFFEVVAKATHLPNAFLAPRHFPSVASDTYLADVSDEVTSWRQCRPKKRLKVEPLLHCRHR